MKTELIAIVFFIIPWINITFYILHSRMIVLHCILYLEHCVLPLPLIENVNKRLISAIIVFYETYI